ncbi:hypothetical protein WAJ58_22230, partial [Acinetobacter baumannii]
AQTGNDFFGFRRFMKVMVGHDNFHIMRVGVGDGFFNLIIAGKSLQIDHINQAAVDGCTIESNISLGGNRLLAAFFGTAEGKQQRFFWHGFT